MFAFWRPENGAGAPKRAPARGGPRTTAVSQVRRAVAPTGSAAAMIAGMDRSVAWRAALLQGTSVAVLALALGAALPRSFFETAGWLAGPGA